MNKKLKIIPFGNRIIVKKIESENIINGIVLTSAAEGDAGVNIWGEVVAVPEAIINPFLKSIKVGDRVLYKRFKADDIPILNEVYAILGVEPESGVRQGQVLAIEHKKNGNKTLRTQR